MYKRDLLKMKQALLELADYIHKEDAHIEIKDLPDNVTRITVKMPDGRCEYRDVSFEEV